MFTIQNIGFTLTSNKIPLCACLSHIRLMSYHIKLDKITKRGLILENMVADKDRRKNWEFSILTNKKQKCRNVFEKVHRPSKRQNVLNSLFIKNITDVISTGNIAPEILGFGIEITGVKISPCCKILNVFWQLPIKHSDASDDIGEKLCASASKIRAELISRNVMGRVPHIYFLRDCTNSRSADFEEAIAKLDFPSSTETAIMPDDSFISDIYRFKTTKVKKDQNPKDKEEKKICCEIPQKPDDMKSDVFGLNHDVMMKKILASKKKAKEPQSSAVITPEMLEKGDLFSKIPGICFEPDITREKILKQFQVDRKKLMKKKNAKLHADDFQNYEENIADDSVKEQNTIIEDFIEEEGENSDNFKL